ncbi:MAG: DUF4097 family beta strand repeat-containing protein [Bacteroidota bacterium]
MKNYSFFLALLFTAAMHAQTDYTQSLDGIEWVKIESKADIVVKTSDDDKLTIKARKTSWKSDRAKGLKLVGAGGTDNTDVGFSVVTNGNTLIVKNLRKSEKGTIYLPKTQNVSVKSTWNGDIRLSGFSSELEVDAELNGGVELNDINGPVTATALNGDIEVTFGKVTQGSPISIYTTNGAVDISMPGDTPANLSMSTVNGEVYSNFDIKQIKKDGMTTYSSRKTTATVNGGGVEIKLKSTNGSIYLRKL